ncbi:MAG: CapA family protein [Armatimonadetes bacterium]|nr:CapA family protein [Armatimonadota bacterium]
MARVILAATGDMMFRHALRDGPPHAWLREADLAFANVEMPLTDRGRSAEKFITFRSDPALVGELVRFGVDVATVANNHAFDFGEEGFLQTLDVFRGAGIPLVGAGRNLEEATAPAVLTAGGMRVAFLALAATLPHGSAAAPDRPGLAPIRVFSDFRVDGIMQEEQPGTAPYVLTTAHQEDVARAEAAVRHARERADAVVVGIHWGVPPTWMGGFQGPLVDYQRPLGHHPHVIHGVERYGRGVICYSLGNFVFHRYVRPQPVRPFVGYNHPRTRIPEMKESVLAWATLAPDGVEEMEFRPVVLDQEGDPAPAEGERAARILERLAAFSEELDTRVALEGTRARLA